MSKEVQKALRKLIPHLLKAQDENLNEADTLLRIIKVFEDVLGYDPLAEISREAQIKDKYVDLAIKIDGVTKVLVEAKSAATQLRDRHMEQAQRYAAEGNIRWVLLTNGVTWNVYHLTFDEGIEYTKALSFDFRVDAIEKCVEQLSLLERRAICRGVLDDYWTHRAALSAASIGRALFTEDVLSRLRREIRRNEDILIDHEDLATALHDLLTSEAREQIGPVKVRKKQKPRLRTPHSGDGTMIKSSSIPPAYTSTDKCVNAEHRSDSPASTVADIDAQPSTAHSTTSRQQD